jgi:glutathione S-transferase
MSKPKLTYFDAPTSRGEECRLALHVAGVDFEDHRLPRADWSALKGQTPFGTLPFLEMPGHAPLAQSNAILVLIGRLHGLHPTEAFEAARHEAVMHYVEDLRVAISPTLRIKDEVERKKARELLASDVIPTWGANVEKQLGEGPFFGGKKLQVVDIKLYVVTRWLKSGVLDHVPSTVLDPFRMLSHVHDAVFDHPSVKAWYAKR